MKKYHKNCKFYSLKGGKKFCRKFNEFIKCADKKQEDYKCWKHKGRGNFKAYCPIKKQWFSWVNWDEENLKLRVKQEGLIKFQRT